MSKEKNPLTSKSVTVEWSEQALADLAALGENAPATAKLAIEKILELDPRPVAYRGTAENPDPYMSRYGFRYENWNVVFQMLPEKRARIERIESWATRSHGETK